MLLIGENQIYFILIFLEIKNSNQKELEEKRKRMREQRLAKKIDFYCQICSKSFKSRAKLIDHEKSKKHKQKLKHWNKNQKKENKTLEVITPDNLANRCLFCHFKGNNFEETFLHMKNQHSFFILGNYFIVLRLKIISR